MLVDARTGRVVRIRDRIRRDTAPAAPFLANPVAAQGSRTGLSDNGDADSATLTALRRPVVLDRLDPGTTCLRGSWVRAVLAASDACAPAATSAPSRAPILASSP